MTLSVFVYFLALLYSLLAPENTGYDAEKNFLNKEMYYFQLSRNI